MLPTYEIKPTFYMKKLKDSAGNLTGEEVPVIQFTTYQPVQYTLSVSDHAPNEEELMNKLLLAAKNGDAVKVQGTSEVRTYANGGSAHLFSAVSCDYDAVKPAAKPVGKP